MKTSPAKSASSGKTNASRRSRTSAPENSAIAATGVKFHGCGAMRNAATGRIMARARMVRKNRLFFPERSRLILLFPPFRAINHKTQNHRGLQLLPGGQEWESERSGRRTRRYGIRRFRRRDRQI